MPSFPGASAKQDGGNFRIQGAAAHLKQLVQGAVDLDAPAPKHQPAGNGSGLVGEPELSGESPFFESGIGRGYELFAQAVSAAAQACMARKATYLSSSMPRMAFFALS